MLELKVNEGSKFRHKDKEKDKDKERDKDKDEGVLGCWIEEIEERRLVTEGPTWSPTPPTFLDISALPTPSTQPNATGKSIKRNTAKFTLEHITMRRPMCVKTETPCS